MGRLVDEAGVQRNCLSERALALNAQTRQALEPLYFFKETLCSSLFLAYSSVHNAAICTQ